MALRILALGQLVSICVGHSGQLLVMSGHTKLTLANNASAAILNVIINAFLIPKYGIVGAAAATTIAITIRNVASLIEARYILQASPFSLPLIKLFVFVISLSIGLLFLKNYLPVMKWWLALGLYCGAFAVAYASLMWFFGINEEDKTFFKTTILSKLPLK